MLLTQLRHHQADKSDCKSKLNFLSSFTAVTDFLFNPKDPQPLVQNFVKQYTATYKREPSSYAALGYDVVRLSWSVQF